MNRPHPPRPTPKSYPAGPHTECRCGTTRTAHSRRPHCDVVRICRDDCEQCQTIKERSA